MLRHTFKISHYHHLFLFVQGTEIFPTYLRDYDIFAYEPAHFGFKGKEMYHFSKASNLGCFKTKEGTPCTLGLGTAWVPQTIWKVWRREKSLAQSVIELIFICCQARSLITLVLIPTDLWWLHTVCDPLLTCAGGLPRDNARNEFYKIRPLSSTVLSDVEEE